MKHLTKNRKEILEIISDSKKPLNVKQIKAKVSFDTSTIYRALDFLEKLEYVHSVIFDNEKYYFRDKNGNFIICNSCKEIEVFPVRTVIKEENTLQKEFGFLPLSHIFLFKGLCKKCNT
jgi:Fur family ferric uptake transcriptional regulator